LNSIYLEKFDVDDRELQAIEPLPLVVSKVERCAGGFTVEFIL